MPEFLGKNKESHQNSHQQVQILRSHSTAGGKCPLVVFVFRLHVPRNKSLAFSRPTMGGFGRFSRDRCFGRILEDVCFKKTVGVLLKNVSQ